MDPLPESVKPLGEHEEAQAPRPTPRTAPPAISGERWRSCQRPPGQLVVDAGAGVAGGVEREVKEMKRM